MLVIAKDIQEYIAKKVWLFPVIFFFSFLITDYKFLQMCKSFCKFLPLLHYL
jgi:hypothetical protein